MVKTPKKSEKNICEFYIDLQRQHSEEFPKTASPNSRRGSLSRLHPKLVRISPNNVSAMGRDLRPNVHALMPQGVVSDVADPQREYDLNASFAVTMA